MDYSRWERCTARGRLRKSLSHCPSSESQTPSLLWKRSAHRCTPSLSTSTATTHPGTDVAGRSLSWKPHELAGLMPPEKPREAERAAANCYSLQNALLQLQRRPCRDSLTHLRSRCRFLEEENSALLGSIKEQEHEAARSATQLLEKYNRAQRNVLVVQSWAERQLQDARQDLQETRQRAEERLQGLRRQLQILDERARDADKELRHLRDYKGRERSVRALQIAGLQRRLRMLSENHQDQVADVEVLAHTEIQNLLDKKQEVEDNTMQSIVQCHIEFLPLSLRQTCLQNQGMKQEIQIHKQLIDELLAQSSYLMERRDSLRRSRKKETEKRRRDLLQGMPRCAPDEDVFLDIPRHEQIPI